MLECTPLSLVAPHFFTTRAIAPGPVHAASVDGWQQIAAEAGVGVGRLCRVAQVHGAAVHYVRRGQPAPSSAALPEADAIVSDDPTVAVSVRVADCVPLLLADRRRGVVAAVHAGWRGTAAHVVRTAVGALGRAFGSGPTDLVAAVGPSIGQCCYQVGPEVRAAFAEAGHAVDDIDRWFSADVGDRLRLDLWRATRDQLQAAGVPPEAIHVARICTATHVDRFFSFRVEGAAAGRLVAVIRAADAPRVADPGGPSTLPPGP